MSTLLMILTAVLLLSFLVVIHEGGHYVAARAFGVRVTEFMIGMPGPNIGVRIGETKFGVTPILLGGYARVCGMDPGELSPHLRPVLAAAYRRGTANMEDIARDCGITDDEAFLALEQLVEWGSLTGPTRKDPYNTYRTPVQTSSLRARRAARRKGLPAPEGFAAGAPREVADEQALYDAELSRQYCNLPFWKRSIILVAGPGVNLLFAVLAFVLVYSVIGFDLTSTDTGEVTHWTVGPLRSLQAGLAYIVAVVQAVAGLFNPSTAAETVSNSTSVVGIAVMSQSYAAAGFNYLLMFAAMISVSLGVMNLLPIPPLDGGRFVIEIYQKLRRKNISVRALNYLSLAGMALFLGFFVVMLNQDIQRFVFGNW